MTKTQAPVVCVFGANDPVEGSQEYELARAVGRKLAELGCVVANGGYGGTMEAAASGAKDAGGRTVGVTCSVWKSRPNAFIDETIDTCSLYERLRTLLELGSGGYVVLPGATGTLAEIAMAWELMAKKLLPRRPLVCVGRFWEPLAKIMQSAKPSCMEYIKFIDSPQELDQCFGA